MDTPRAMAGMGRRRVGCAAMFALLWLGSAAVQASTTPLNGAWREVRANDTPQIVLAEFRAGQLDRFDPAALKRFPANRRGNWIVISPQPPWNNNARVLTIYPPPLQTLTVFAGGHAQTLASDDFSAANHGHGRLGWQVPETVQASAPIVLKLEPSSMASAPIRFAMQARDVYLQRDAQWLAFASACFAVMLAMTLIALCFSFMLGDATYAWYAGYILCYALIQGIQSGYVFHPLQWSWLSGTAPLVLPAAVALSVAFAALFMVRFCQLRQHAPLLRGPVTALAVGMIQLVLMRCSGVPLLIDVAQLLFDPLLILGVVVLLSAAVLAVARGPRQGWFFLAGWTPLLILTAVTSHPFNGALPHWSWLNNAGLAGGALEAMVLSLGFVDRALGLRRDRDHVRLLANQDPLTNLLNRRAWSERASVLFGSMPSRPMTVLFLDLDHFKLLNDLHGHHAGDRALLAVAKTLTAELRPGDLLGRYGGEEFVALLDGTCAEHAAHVSTRLCRKVHRLEIPVDEDARFLTISIGVAAHRTGETLESLVERADQAMYGAKLNGRNQACRFESLAAKAPNAPRLHLVEGSTREH